MTSREQSLALTLIAAVVLVVGALGGYMFVYKPLQANKEQQGKLEDEIQKLEGDARVQAANAKKLAAARLRSLPADSDLAKREYVAALARLLETAGAPKTGYTIGAKVIDNRGTPEITKGKPLYTRVAYDVEIRKADMWIVTAFLKGYYDLGLLHQITNFSIKKEDDAGAKGVARRNDLTVKLTTEAIIMEMADNRRTLLPVPTAFAAVGGGGLFTAMRVIPEAGRGVTPKPTAPVLAPKNRDYSLIVLKDPFNGPLAPPPSFKMSPLSPVVVKQDETPSPVKVALSGEGAQGARVRATVTGTLFPEGELKVDPKTNAITLPKTSADEGTAVVSVVATSVEGKVEKGSFKVSVERGTVTRTPDKPDTRDEVSSAILFTMLTFRSDGTATATIRDSASRQRYAVEFAPSGVKVLKEKFDPKLLDEKTKLVRPGWAEDEAHKKLPAGILNLSDATSKTNRTFKVVAVDAEGLILADLRPDTATAPPPAVKGGKGGGMGGGMGGKFDPAMFQPGGMRPRQGPANPLSAIAGNMAGTVPAAPSKLYRWAPGQSLATATVKPLADEEAKKITKQAERTGPMLFTAGSTGN